MTDGAWSDVLATSAARCRHAVPVRQPGECLTEKSGRINLGLEGVLVFSAMAVGASYLSGSPWVARSPPARGALLALPHGVLCTLPRVSDIATGSR
jgi:simple sugar transport system permease protein